MRVLIAPTRFAGTLTARQAAAAVAEGWHEGAPHDSVTMAPMSDGGPGFLDAMAGAVPGQVLAVTASDPDGAPAPATILRTDEAGGTAYLEASQVLSRPSFDPARTTSRGLGELVRQALSTGARRVVVGLGSAADTDVHDAGAGFLSALGVGDGALTRGGLGLRELTAADLSGLPDVVQGLRGVELVLATRDDLPLLGLQGASAVEAEPRGVRAEDAQLLEDAFGHFAALTTRALPADAARTDLLTGRQARLERASGAGAGGGLGYAVLLLGGRIIDGATLTGTAIGLPRAAAESDVIVTGEGSFGWRSLRRSVASYVAQVGMACAVPTVVLAGDVQVGRRETMAAGFSGAYGVLERADQRAGAIADPAGALAVRARRVARTWSPAA